MYIMEMSNGETLTYMKNRKSIYSRDNDFITIIASAKNNVPGYIRICSGNFTKDRQFRYNKCEIFTSVIPRQQELQIYMKDVEVYYSYLFSRDKSKAVQQVSLDNSSESKVFKNQNSFHYTAPVGWLNDPVGLCFYKGLYHMFYQFNPASQKWGDAHWGHVTSTDLLHWKEHPIILSPQPEIISNPLVRGGAFSGSALIEKNKMYLFFTRHVGDLEKRHCLEYTVSVSSDNGFEFSGEQTVVDDLPVELGENFRDPKVWKEENEWLMLTGTETSETAAISIHRSVDLKNWEYTGVFLDETDKKYLRAECPSLIKIQDKYILIAGYHNKEPEIIRRDTVYYIGTIQDYKFQIEAQGLLDYGKDFYAAQIFANLDTPILIGWVNDRYEHHIEELSRSNGSMSLPRKLWIANGRLYSYPIEKIETLKEKSESFTESFTVKDGRGHLHVILEKEGKGRLVLARSEAGKVSIEIGSGLIKIEIDDEEWSAEWNTRELDIYMDNALLEVFVNHGEYAFTRRYEHYKTDYQIEAELSTGCSATFCKIRF